MFEDNTKEFSKEEIQAFNPNLKASIVGDDIDEEIWNELSGEVKVLKVSDLIPGEPFIGLVWVENSTATANIYDFSKYDIRISFIDGVGGSYRGVQWSRDEKIHIENTPVIITGVAVSNMNDSGISIKIKRMDYYDRSVPKGFFIKQLDNIDWLVQSIESKIGTGDQVLDNCISYLFYNLQILNNMKLTTYKPRIGTKLGAKLLVMDTLLTQAQYLQTMYTNVDMKLYKILLACYMCNLQQVDDQNKTLTSQDIKVNFDKAILDLISQQLGTANNPVYNSYYTTIATVIVGNKPDYTIESKLLFNGIKSIETMFKDLQSV